MKHHKFIIHKNKNKNIFKKLSNPKAIKTNVVLICLMIWLIVFLLLCAIPLGLILSLIKKDEKEIYTKYFYTIKWMLLILTAFFLTTNKTYALSTSFILITIIFWDSSEKVINFIKQRLKKGKSLIKR
jgi:hypothetical protein